MDLKLTSNVDRQPKPYSDDEEGLTAAARYQRLVTSRDAYLQRARDCSKVTIPTLIPDAGDKDRGTLKTPYQSLGARGVNYLASKLLITLFPPNSAFFKLEIDDLVLRATEGGPEIKAEFDSALVNVEHAVMTAMETANGRASMHEAFKHLLVGGNVLLYVAEDGFRVIHLNRYALCRDPMGHVIEIVVEEEVYPEVLPADFLEAANADDDDSEGYSSQKTLKLYTHIEYENDKVHWYQEAKGKEIPGTHGMCDTDVSPWIPLRFNRVDGEEYGRGYVEEYYGDLLALEALYQAVLEGSAAAAKILFLVNPNGTTRPRTLANAANGSIIQGNATDVTVIQSQKSQDLSIANSVIDRIEGRLQFAFLLNTAIQRPGERVTAQEIRYMSQELEAGIGGLYSILTQELQLPLVRRLMHVMRKQRKLPAFPKGDGGKALVNPKPVTGLEAIGRGDDRNKLVDFITTVGQVLGPDVLQKYINVDEALRRLANSESIDTTNLVKTKEQLDGEAAAANEQMVQQQQQAMVAQGMKSPALANLVNNYTQEGSPYGPQPNDEGIPNQFPDPAGQQQLPAGEGAIAPGSPV
ncbi:MAG: phage tail protein [Burkholderiaceae bacterium]|nr:phage tail protein [Burkholderiaceae bacterium]